jgi:hypothetical protein
MKYYLVIFPFLSSTLETEFQKGNGSPRDEHHVSIGYCTMRSFSAVEKFL